MSVHVRDRDRGFKKVVKAIRESRKGPPVSIGIHSSEGGEADGDGEVTVLEVAIWNEFGTRRIPARSFLRSWFDENKDEALRLWKGLMKKVIHGEITRDQAMEQFGLKCVGEIQQRIADGIPPPNADSTIARKGSSTPLINTGQLRSSITHKVGS